MHNIISTFKPRQHKFSILTVAIVAWFILFPFLESRGIGVAILNLLTSLIVLFGIYAVSQSRRIVFINISFGMPWFIISWIDILIVQLPKMVMLLSNLLLILFLTFTAIQILLFIIRSKQINADILYGSVCIYFLIGGAWSTIYILLNSIQPGAIVNTINESTTFSDLIYFSFVTLTTLGYGEIIPVTASARSLVIIEAIVGIMYIAIIISRLVGLFIVKSLKD